ncbi:DUF4239 domain-containing protein [Kitasatospora viridis]|uniref:Uncharacterized protein DUF4239 n=1 Tax=Kitasatospora viridis TaxID=281105 RepID=A0A561UKH5_9ACTN|nr:DUF4239 domain-containing protein [Kitasatospora viridis]TWF99863.1 uncharacterized protein DUF4239 [Kitasatospora viridis]
MNAIDVWVLVGSLLFVAVVLAVVTKSFPHTSREPHNDVAGFIFAVVGVLYAVLLGFVVITVWDNSAAAKGTTFKEADALAGVYWMSRQMPMPLGAQLEDQTLQYAHAVIGPEWRDMEDHRSDPGATQLMYDIRASALSFQPSNAREQVLYQRTVDDVEELAGQRRARLSEIEDLVPTLLWVSLVGGGALTIGFTFLFGLSNTWAHLAMVLILTSLVVVPLVAIKEMDYPFKGVNAVQPIAYQVFLARLPPER